MEVTAAERTATYTGAQSLAAKINGYIVAQRTSIAAIAQGLTLRPRHPHPRPPRGPR